MLGITHHHLFCVLFFPDKPRNFLIHIVEFCKGGLVLEINSFISNLVLLLVLVKALAGWDKTAFPGFLQKLGKLDLLPITCYWSVLCTLLFFFSVTVNLFDYYLKFIVRKISEKMFNIGEISLPRKFHMDWFVRVFSTTSETFCF